MSVQYGGDKITFADGSTVASGFTGFKNRILNGDMRIDQRNAGAAISTTAGFPVDRFQMALTAAIGSTFTAQQSSTAPTGFPNSFVWTVGTAGTATGTQSARFNQLIEGYNVADMGFGASGASTFTLSFWVRASVTGTYCVFFNNDALDRSYVAEYTISASNTWEQKTITVAGDISGTWLKTNGAGIRVGWNLGDGPDRNTTAGSWVSGFYTRTSSQTNFIGNAGATFYITGVQLEKGSTATSFDYRPYGTELALCQRYYQTNPRMVAFGRDSSTIVCNLVFPVEMRATPSVILRDASSFYWESIAWSSVGSATNGSTNNGHISTRGGDLLITATYSPSPSGNYLTEIGGSILHISAEL